MAESQEFFDSRWNSNNTEFRSCQQIITQLKSLREQGENLNDGYDAMGNNYLHRAVKYQKKEVFDYLIELEEVEVDVLNKTFHTPLDTAVQINTDYYAKRLLEKGANINLGATTSLHLAKDPKMIELLIENGADINRQERGTGQTAFSNACSKGDEAKAVLLLRLGANPLIEDMDRWPPFGKAFLQCDSLPFLETLFRLTFHKPVPIHLQVFEVAMTKKPSFFDRLMDVTTEIIYRPSELHLFSSMLSSYDFDSFRKLTTKFPKILEDLDRICNCVQRYFLSLESANLNLAFVKFLCEKMSSYTFSFQEFYYLLILQCRQDTLSSIISCLQSFNCKVSASLLDRVYEREGFSPLFEKLLLLEVPRDESVPKVITRCNLVPLLIYQVNFNVVSHLANVPRIIDNDTLQLLSWFNHPKLKAAYRKRFVSEQELSKLSRLPVVPSLVQLSRDVLRPHIIKHYRIRNNAEFFRIISVLPVPVICRDILTYKKKLYFVQD